MEGPGNRLALTVVRDGASADYATKPHFRRQDDQGPLRPLGSLDMTLQALAGEGRTGAAIDRARRRRLHRRPRVHRRAPLHPPRRPPDQGRHALPPGPAAAGARATPTERLPTRGSSADRRRRTWRHAVARRSTRRTVAPDTWSRSPNTALQGIRRRGRGLPLGTPRRDGSDPRRPDRHRRGRGSDWDLDAGTASLPPPAPFTGSATLHRARAAAPRAGAASLRVPILGGRPLRLDRRRASTRILRQARPSTERRSAGADRYRAGAWPPRTQRS